MPELLVEHPYNMFGALHGNGLYSYDDTLYYNLENMIDKVIFINRNIKLTTTIEGSCITRYSTEIFSDECSWVCNRLLEFTSLRIFKSLSIPITLWVDTSTMRGVEVIESCQQICYNGK